MTVMLTASVIGSLKLVVRISVLSGQQAFCRQAMRNCINGVILEDEYKERVN